MKIEKIFFEQLFPTGQYQNVKLGIEMDVSDSSPSEITSHYQYLMDKVNSAFNALFPSTTPSITDYNTGMQGIQEPPKVINLEAERIAIQIENSTSVQELRGYGDKAVIHGLMDIYEKKLAELTK